MRAEIKIGIAVGLVIAVVAIVYFLVFNQPPSSQQEQQALKKPAPPAAEAPKSGETLTPTVAAAPAASSKPAETITPTFARSEPPALPPSLAAPTKTPPAAATKPSSPSAGSIDVKPIAAESKGTVYTVRKGDTGFWSVAEHAYGPGKGKYWTLIEKANPKVDTNKLTEGMTLIIPPLPEGRPAEPSVGAATVAGQGTSLTLAAGEKVYAVQPGDSWWSIAYKECNNGNLWMELKKANPHVETLRVGQKIKIPSAASLSKTAGGASTAPAPSPKPSAKPSAKTAAPTSAPVSFDRPIFD
jgi:nucleoid-associated protein YgaU